MYIRFQHIATELMCSDVTEIVERCLEREDELLTPFFARVLDQEDEHRNAVTVSQFFKVVAAFVGHKPAEVLVLFANYLHLVDLFPDV